MGYAFISYSTKNQSEADAMKRLIEKNGVSSWMAPYDIPAGSSYSQIINIAIKECACFVLLLSCESQNSVWVLKELDRAISYKKTVIPVQIDDVVLNDKFEFYLCTDQIVAINKIDEESSLVKKIMNTIIGCTGQDYESEFMSNEHYKSGVKTDSETEISKKLDQLANQVYEILIEYRSAIRIGDESEINKYSQLMSNKVQKIYEFYERYRYTYPEKSSYASCIVEQYNLYVEKFNDFISNGRQELSAKTAENEFGKLLEMLIKYMS